MWLLLLVVDADDVVVDVVANLGIVLVAGAILLDIVVAVTPILM